MTSEPSNILEVHFDFISPYAYLAWCELRRWQLAGMCSIVPHPVLFAGLLAAHGTLGPAEVPAKRDYVFLDALRKAAHLDVSLEPPFGHPFNPLQPLRSVVALQTMNCNDDETTNRAIDELFRSTWELSEEVSSPTLVERALGRAGLTAAHSRSVLDLAASAEIKDRLRQATEAAVSRGVFGVPTIVHDHQLFWGVDSLPHVADSLAGRSPITSASRQAWSKVRPLAQRRVGLID